MISYFANETFQNATINDPEFEDFSLAKDEAYEWNDVLGQKAHVCNYWIPINYSNHFFLNQSAWIKFVDHLKDATKIWDIETDDVVLTTRRRRSKVE